MASSVASSDLNSNPSSDLNSNPYSISILVVSTGEFCKQLSTALHDAKQVQDYKYSFEVHTCECVADVLKSDKPVHVDYIVFAMDTRRKTCLKEVDSNITELDPLYMCSKMCLVIGNEISPLEMGVSINSIWELKNKYSMHVLVGDINNYPKCLYLAGRILILVSAAFGMKSGVPYIDWPRKGPETEVAAPRHISFTEEEEEEKDESHEEREEEN